MQISQIYSNADELFPPISFHSGAEANHLNVILAEVSDNSKSDRDSHNLGKTTLIHLIDFLLLKSVAGDGHFLTRHASQFSRFVFYIELLCPSGEYVTIRRAAADPNHIDMAKHVDALQDFRKADVDVWDHTELPLIRARELLDAYLSLAAVKPWTYRTGVTYFLRTQEDYQDYFQVAKFRHGKHRDWKPYLARILGLSHDAMRIKYELDETIKTKEQERFRTNLMLGDESGDQYEISTKIEILRDEIDETSSQLDAFQFHLEEHKINADLVNQVEREISVINEEVYNLTIDLQLLEDSIKSGLSFNLKSIQQLFEESSIHFPDGLAKSYEELVDFNRRLTRDRNKMLRSQIGSLQNEVRDLEMERASLDQERQKYLAVLRGAEVFDKYKSLQGLLTDQRVDLRMLENQLEKLIALEIVDAELEGLKSDRRRKVSEIEASLKRGGTVKSKVVLLFNRYVKRVLNVNGQFIVRMNESQNVDFDIHTTDTFGVKSSQSDGHSYHRLLCVLFDLAVLRALADEPFYHFVYHDGLVEGLDDRVQVRLMELIRELTSDAKVQYIFSVIEHDLPRSQLGIDEPVFSDDEIVLRLHDDGDDGRLFKMPQF